MCDHEGDGESDETDVNDQLGEEGFQRELSFGSSRERQDDTAHDYMHDDAIENAAEDWPCCENRQAEADCVVDRSNDEGDEEVEEQADRGGSFASFERGGSQSAAGYALP